MFDHGMKHGHVEELRSVGVRQAWLLHMFKADALFRSEFENLLPILPDSMPIIAEVVAREATVSQTLQEGGRVARPGTEIEYRGADVEVPTNNVGDGPIGVYANATHIAPKRKSLNDVIEGRLYALGVYCCHRTRQHCSPLFAIVHLLGSVPATVDPLRPAISCRERRGVSFALA